MPKKIRYAAPVQRIQIVHSENELRTQLMPEPPIASKTAVPVVAPIAVATPIFVPCDKLFAKTRVTIGPGISISIAVAIVYVR